MYRWAGENEEIFQITTGCFQGIDVRLDLCRRHHGIKGSCASSKRCFRIAFRAQEENGEEDGVQIVLWAGLWKICEFPFKILVNFGEPLAVNQFYKAYLEDCPRAINAIRSKLSEEMSKYMIDIRSAEFYDTYMNLRTIYNQSMRRRHNIQGKICTAGSCDKELIRILEKTEERNWAYQAGSEKVKNILMAWRSWDCVTGYSVRTDTHISCWFHYHLSAYNIPTFPLRID